MLVYAEKGAWTCKAFLKRVYLQALINAVPRTQIKGKLVRSEAEVLDRLRLAFFEELEVRVGAEMEENLEQLGLKM